MEYVQSAATSIDSETRVPAVDPLLLASRASAGTRAPAEMSKVPSVDVRGSHRFPPMLGAGRRRGRRILHLAGLFLAALVACTFFSAGSNINLDRKEM